MMTLTEIISITGATLLQGKPQGEITGVSTDTRTVRPGDLFIALRGERYDGHDFVAEALQKGAAAALVSRPLPLSTDSCLLLVADTLQALGLLAANWRRRFNLPVIAVTGSVGKTTTKEMLASILSQRGEILKTAANYNNEIGVPLAALGLRPSHQAAVFELAMRGRGQIRYLAEIISPTIGVITNIGLSHLELLSSSAAIVETKAELLEVMGKDGVAVLPAESEHFSLLKQKAGRVITFGLERGDVQARNISLEDESVSFRFRLPVPLCEVAKSPLRYEARVAGEEAGSETEWLAARLSVPGRHNVLNALAAAAAAKCAGATEEQIVQGLQAFRTVSGRMRILRAPAGFTVIDDAYNASPDSMRAALGVLADLPGERKIAVLGDMRELGPQSESLHRALGREAAAVPLAFLVTVGELGKEISLGAAHAPTSAGIASVSTAQEALAVLAGRLRPGDVVLIKASRALGLEAVVEGLLALAS